MSTVEVRSLPDGNVQVILSDDEITVARNFTRLDARKLAALVLQAAGDPLHRDKRDIADYKKASNGHAPASDTAA